MRNNLKFSIINLGQPQYAIAAKCGISETRLSRLVRGRADPTEEERRALARVLRAPEARLFTTGDEQPSA